MGDYIERVYFDLCSQLEAIQYLFAKHINQSLLNRIWKAATITIAKNNIEIDELGYHLVNSFLSPFLGKYKNIYCHFMVRFAIVLNNIFLSSISQCLQFPNSHLM